MQEALIDRRRSVLIVAALAGIAAVMGPKSIDLTRFNAFLAGDAYATMLLLTLIGFCLGALQPADWALVGATLGSGVVLYDLVRIAHQGFGNLWPLLFVLWVVIGFGPAILGSFLGARARRLARHTFEL